jgi:site-specific DNA recombinase
MKQAKGKGKRAPRRVLRLFEEKFAAVLSGLSFDQDTLAWVRRALMESHRDERQFHADAVARLQREHRRIQERLERMYEDKLDGRIDNDFYDKKAAEYRNEQARITRDLQAHGSANQLYMEDGSGYSNWRSRQA